MGPPILRQQAISCDQQLFNPTIIFVSLSYIFILQMFKQYITTEGLRELDNYKYKPGGSTWLDSKMNYFWQWLVTLFPKWIAPNLITFIGWLLVIASYGNMLRYDYTFTKDLPPYCFFFAAACIFMYMNMDAIDGKQARRTGSSSPLGQLFDHGCDSFSVNFFVLGLCQATQLEAGEVFLVFIVCQVSFWVANWGEYNTGILRTKVGQYGVTEAEFTLIFVYLITGFFGTDFWFIRVSDVLPLVIKKNNIALYTLYKMKFSEILIYGLGSLFLLMNIYLIFKTILQSKEKKKTCLQFSSLLIMIVMEISWSRLEIYGEYSGFILLNFGIIQSLLICKMIICSVTKMKFSAFHWQLSPLIISSVILWIMRILQVESYWLSLVFNASFVINIGISIAFLYSAINQITQYLGIYCFSLEKKTKRND